jgi:hypothetical protein
MHPELNINPHEQTIKTSKQSTLEEEHKAGRFRISETPSMKKLRLCPNLNMVQKQFITRHAVSSQPAIIISPIATQTQPFQTRWHRRRWIQPIRTPTSLSICRTTRVRRTRRQVVARSWIRNLVVRGTAAISLCISSRRSLRRKWRIWRIR